MDYAQIIQEIIPKEEVPQPFQIIGNIALFKMPLHIKKYMVQIAEVYLDKTPQCKAVINVVEGKKEVILNKGDNFITQNVSELCRSQMG